MLPRKRRYLSKNRESEVKVTVEAPLGFGDIMAYVDICQIQSENQLLAARSSGVIANAESAKYDLPIVGSRPPSYWLMV